MKKVIVIGAGLAGLTAARTLQHAGFAVRVLEAQAQPGGRMGQRQSGPITYNTGARLIYPFGKRLHALVDEMDLRTALLPLRGLSAWCQPPGEPTTGRQHAPYRIDLMPSARVLATPGLGLCGRLGLARSAVSLLAWRGKTDPDLATSVLAANASMDTLTLADYLRQSAGAAVLERLVEPVFRGTRSQNPETISPTFYLSTTPHLIGHDTVYTLQGGMGVLPQALVQGLDVQYGACVTGVETGVDAGEPCTVRVRSAAGEHTLGANRVVCATEGSHAARLVKNPSPEQRRILSAVRYNSLGILHVALKGDLPPLLEFAPRPSHAHNTRIATWQQTPARGDTPALLYCQLTPEAVMEAMDQGCTDDVQRLIWPQIRARLPDVDARVLHVVNQWIPHKLPVFYPGYGQQVVQFLAWQQTGGAQQVYFCGDWLSQPLLNGACRSGADAAAALIEHWQR